MARGCDLGFGWMDSQPASKPVSHTRHIRHAGHAAITAKVTALRINFSGTLPQRPGDGHGNHGGATEGGVPSLAIDELTSDDLSAFADYTGSGYIDMNEALRSDALDASQSARIEALNNALGKLPAYEGPVVRGTNLSRSSC